MSAKDLLDSSNAQNSKPAANANNQRNTGSSEQKKNRPCKNSLPT